MFFLKLVVRNVFRAKLRSTLTIVGLVIAVLAFGLLQTVVRAWYAGSDAASATRLIARNAISLTFSMPVYYREKIRAVPGVTGVSVSNWFGGIYREPKNFFAQFAVDAPTYFPMYPEFIFEPDQYAAFLRDRRGAVVGRQLADLYGFKVGDTIPLKSTIYPGNWEFTVRAIYDARDETTITRQMYFHFDYLNEQIKKVFPRRADQAGVFVVGIADSSASADIARAIDAEFKNSLAETLTETEKAFTLGFVAMIETIVVAIEGVSYVVILIIMAVAANTMAMTARERLSEYATLKALGFAPHTVALLIMTEAILLAVIGGAIGMLLTAPVVQVFHAATISVFAKMPLVPQTFYLQAACALVVGVVAGIVPAVRASRIRIVDGLRHVA
ncbi:MAG: FtsX-like permease family protein [Burkholderiaceae bacterium]|jgi:putative ABC transport system permease protein|nr:FtsX-like permease family protein [Burkholderiaceae bacterium]